MVMLMRGGPYGDKLVIFFCVGVGDKTFERFGVDPWKLLYSDRRFEEIMLLLSERGMNIDELLSQLNIDRGDLVKLLDELKKHGLIFERENKFLVAIPVLSEKSYGKIEKYLLHIADLEANVIERYYSKIVGAVKELSFGEFSNWGSLVHIIVNALILDLGVLDALNKLEESRGTHEYYSNWQRVIPFFGIENSSRIPQLGVNSNLFDNFGFSVMHSTLFTRTINVTSLMRKARDKAKLLTILFRKESIYP